MLNYKKDEFSPLALDPVVINRRTVHTSHPPSADKIRSQPLSYERIFAFSKGTFRYEKNKLFPEGYTNLSALYIAPYVGTRPKPSNAFLDSLLLKHRNAIGEKVSNILDIIRTRRESVNMVTQNVKSLAKAIYFLKSGKWQKAKRALRLNDGKQPVSRDIPARWLELQYGWMPLIGDVYTLTQKPFREPVFEVRTTRFFKPDRWNYSTSFYHGSYIVGTTYAWDFEYRCTYVTKFKIKSALIQNLDALGILNPSLVAWESVPFSFIVDWFIPIGDWLGTFTDLKGIEIVDNCFTTVCRGTASNNTRLRVRGIFQYEDTNQHVLAAASYYRKTRTVKSLGFPVPRFKNPLSLGHFANAMSLLATNVKSK